MPDQVLVTGISGFIASHVAFRLLAKGYTVRGTVRNKDKGARIFKVLAQAGADVSKLELVEADLNQDAGWADAVKDCRYIQHIASPFPQDAPSDREALVPAARAGTQRVLENGFSAGAERIVMTSSFLAMSGRKVRGKHKVISESDWTDPEWRVLTAYPVSKTRAELSAWAYAKAQGFEQALTTICPGLVLGPDSYKNAGASLQIIKSMLSGELSGLPKMSVAVIDVRDCAAVHVAAMGAKEAGGRRLIAAKETLWFREIGKILSAEFPQMTKIPTNEVPNFIMRLVALFNPDARRVLPNLGVQFEIDNAYAQSMTQVVPRPAKEAIIAAAQSLIENGDLAV